MITTENNAITAEQRDLAAKVLHGLPFAKLMGMQLVDLQLDMATIKIDMRDDRSNNVEKQTH